MSLMHFEPFRAFRDLDRVTSQLLSGGRVPQSMPMDVWREGQTYSAAMDLPGVDPASVEVQVERNTLTVTAERRASFPRPGGSSDPDGEPGGQASGGEVEVLVAERPQGRFMRQLVLGDGLDTQQVSADYRDGVLYLTIPLAQSAHPRRIQVGTSSGSSSQPSPQVIDQTGGNTSS